MLVCTGAEEQIINELLVDTWMCACDAYLGGHDHRGWGRGGDGVSVFFISPNLVN